MATQSEKFWSAADQRWLRTEVHPTYQKLFHLHFDGALQQWVFFRWAERPDSHSGPSGQGAAAAGYRGQGPMVEGTYNLLNPTPNTHYERLDTSYFVRNKAFFQPGKVFSVLFTEGAGVNTPIQEFKKDAISTVKFGELVYTQIRRFVVVQQKREFCFALPIFTYGNQGTKKHGVVHKEHAIAYSYGYQPTPLFGEAQLDKDPICIVPVDNNILSTASRIYFGIHHPIQYNVKVKDLGYVLPDDLGRLLGYWAVEHSFPTSQEIEAGD